MIHSSLTTYVLGFIASVVLTVAAFGVLFIHETSGHTVFTHPFMMFAIISLALIQLLIQLVCFLNLGIGSTSRWNVAALVFTLLIVLTVVVGSLWIMNNLNYKMMSESPTQMDAYMLDQ